MRPEDSGSDLHTYGSETIGIADLVFACFRDNLSRCNSIHFLQTVRNLLGGGDPFVGAFKGLSYPKGLFKGSFLFFHFVFCEDNINIARLPHACLLDMPCLAGQ